MRIIRAALVQFSNPRSIRGWGDVIDPDGDCTFRLQGGKLSIVVPGTLHDLAAEIGKLNAPAVLTDAEEDFAATVYVTEKLAPGGQCTRPSFLPYQGTGLLLWDDPGNYVRLERAAIIHDGRIVPYVTFELHEKGRRQAASVGVSDGPIHLRLVRRGNQITGSVSNDGKAWKDLRTLTVDYPTKVKLGVLAVNSSTQPFTAVLEGLHVGPAVKPNAR
jgi:regulation of enolase protein 1 (concanavalin A-like superfamily)